MPAPPRVVQTARSPLHCWVSIHEDWALWPYRAYGSKRRTISATQKEDSVAKKLDKIIVVDIESTCWEGAIPAGQESEIIEIGVCTLDIASGRRLEKESILVKPERSKVSPFCTQLTTLTQAQVDQGIAFPEACSILKKKYLSQQRVWASYGD